MPKRKRKFLVVGVATLSILLASCSRFDPTRVGPGGLPPTIELLNYADVANRQTELVRSLTEMAGLQGAIPPVPSEYWFLITKAGLDLVDGQCHQYIDALFRYNREQRGIAQGLAITGAGTAAIMGLASASAQAIAITAAAFGLGSALFDASAHVVLFQRDPSAVNSIVNNALSAYKAAVLAQPKVYTSRPDAMMALQGYLALCTPAVIEAMINEAAIQSTFVSRPGEIANPSPPIERIDRPNTSKAVETLTRAQQVAQQALQQAQQALQRVESRRPPPAPSGPQSERFMPGPAGVMSREQFGRIQEALCVKPGEDARVALGQFRRGLFSRKLTDKEALADLTLKEREELLGMGSCEGFLSAFERAKLHEVFVRAQKPPENKILNDFVKKLMGNNAPTLTSSRIPQEVRQAIEKKRNDLGITDGPKESITAELWDKVTNPPANK